MVREVARTRGLVAAIVRGLARDAPEVAMEALAALGDAFLLSGAVPPRTLPDAFPQPVLHDLLALYTARADAPALRHALHAFLVPLTTGRLLVEPPAAVEAYHRAALTFAAEAPAGIDPAAAPAPVSSSSTAKRHHADAPAAATAPPSGDGGSDAAAEVATPAATLATLAAAAGRDPTLSDDVYAAEVARLGVAHSVASLFGVRSHNNAGAGPRRPAASTPAAPDAEGNPPAGASGSGDAGGGRLEASFPVGDDAPFAVTYGARGAAGGAGVGASPPGGGGADDGDGDGDGEDAFTAATAAAAAALTGGAPSGRRGPGGAASTAASTVLDFLGSIKEPEDPLVRDLIVRCLRLSPATAAAYTAAFPYTLEPRDSSRWAANLSLLDAALEVATATAALPPHTAPSATLTVHAEPPAAAAAAAASTAAAAAGSSGSLPGGGAGVAAWKAAALGGATSAAAARDAAAAAAAGGWRLTPVDGAVDGVGVVGGVAVSALVRALLPVAAARGVLTRGILHANPAVTFHALGLLARLLRRFDAVATRVLRNVHVLVADGPATGDDAGLVAARAATAAAVGAARVAAVAPLLAAALPDIQTVVAVRARLPALAAGGAGRAVFALGLQAAPGTGVWLSAPAMAASLHVRLLAVLRAFLRVLPAAALGSASGGAGGGGAGGGVSGAAGFDYLKLLPGADGASFGAGATPSDTLAHHPAARLPQPVAAELLALLAQLPPPSAAEVAERWLPRALPPALAAAAASADADVGASATGVIAPLPPAGAQVAASPPCALTSCLRLLAAPAPPPLPRLAALLRRPLAQARDPSAPSGRLFRPTPLTLEVAGGATSSPPGSVTEVDAWLAAVARAHVRDGAGGGVAAACAFVGLVWCGSNDATPSPFAAGARADLFAGGGGASAATGGLAAALHAARLAGVWGGTGAGCGGGSG